MRNMRKTLCRVYNKKETSCITALISQDIEQK